MDLPLHTAETAPESARDSLTSVQAAFGFLPNLLATLASAPSALKAYLTLSQTFEQTSFDATERQIVLLTTSFENGCEYCVAAHSVIASMQSVPEDVVDAIRDGTPLADGKLEALRQFARGVVVSRGWPDDAVREGFLAAGYAPGQALEVVLGVTLKTLSNYTNHLAETPLDLAFAPRAWTKSSKV